MWVMPAMAIDGNNVM